MRVFQVSMLEGMKSLREEIQYMKKSSEVEVDNTFASNLKAGPDPNTQPNPWISNHSDAQPMEMAPNTRIFIPNTRITIPNTPNNIKGCVLPEPRNTRTKRNTRFRQNTFHSLQLQKRISPLSLLKGLLSPKGLLLSKTNNNKIIQTQSFTGR